MARRASRQHGIVTRRQLLTLGFTETMFDARTLSMMSGEPSLPFVYRPVDELACLPNLLARLIKPDPA